jgi:hypothetical protein
VLSIVCCLESADGKEKPDFQKHKQIVLQQDLIAINFLVILDFYEFRISTRLVGLETITREIKNGPCLAQTEMVLSQAG